MSGKKVWRLSKTLARPVTVRPIEDEDVKYAWGAYRKKGLDAMGPPFSEEGMGGAEFKQAFEIAVLSNFDAAWTVMAQTRQGFIPVGFVFGGWSPLKAFMIVAGIVWLPWASKRNILEGTVAYFNMVRKDMNVMGFASAEHKRLYETCMAHGIMRRIGTSHLATEPVAAFETRR